MRQQGSRSTLRVVRGPFLQPCCHRSNPGSIASARSAERMRPPACEKVIGSKTNGAPAATRPRWWARRQPQRFCPPIDAIPYTATISNVRRWARTLTQPQDATERFAWTLNFGPTFASQGNSFKRLSSPSRTWLSRELLHASVTPLNSAVLKMDPALPLRAQRALALATTK
jgi:hypothetical protein